MPRPKKPITKGSRRKVTKTSPKKGTGTAKAYTPRKKTAPVMRSENVAQFRATTAKAPSMPKRKAPVRKAAAPTKKAVAQQGRRGLLETKRSVPKRAPARKPATTTGQLAKRGLKGNVRTTASPSPRGRSYVRRKPTTRTTTRRKSTRFRNI